MVKHTYYSTRVATKNDMVAYHVESSSGESIRIYQGGFGLGEFSIEDASLQGDGYNVSEEMRKFAKEVSERIKKKRG